MAVVFNGAVHDAPPIDLVRPRVGHTELVEDARAHGALAAVGGAHDGVAVGVADGCLGRGEEAGAEHGCVGAQGQRGRDASPVANAARRDQGHGRLEGGVDFGQEGDDARPSFQAVAAGVRSLDDEHVRRGVPHRLDRLRHAADLHPNRRLAVAGRPDRRAPRFEIGGAVRCKEPHGGRHILLHDGGRRLQIRSEIQDPDPDGEQAVIRTGSVVERIADQIQFRFHAWKIGSRREEAEPARFGDCRDQARAGSWVHGSADQKWRFGPWVDRLE